MVQEGRTGKALLSQSPSGGLLEQEVVIVLGVGMPERQKSNREVVRSQRKKQMSEIC